MASRHIVEHCQLPPSESAEGTRPCYHAGVYRYFVLPWCAMTADQFRRLALSLPGVVEGAHMGHPDFRVGGKIFASLAYPDDAWGVLRLTLEQQQRFVRTEPAVFKPVKGGWGLKGATNVCLKSATKAKLSTAMVAAWRNLAPEDLAGEIDD